MEDKSSMEEKNSINEKDSIEVKNSIEERNSAEDSMEEAVGLLEVYGLVCAFLAADAGCKAADVRLEIFDKNKPANAESLPVPLLVTVKFRGSVAAVEAAMEAGERKAKSVTGVVQRHIIPRPTGDTGKMLKISAFDKN
jgi:microcompartment protein CcmL/EutN